MKSFPKTITVDGQPRRVLDRLRVGGREYFVLERLSGGARERYLVFDPSAGPRGDLRALLILPFSQGTFQHLRVLQRLTQHHASFPSIIEYHRRDHQVYLLQSWVRGRTLEELLHRARRQPRSWPTAIQAFQTYRRLAHALGQLHNVATCVHADLKPAHILLVRQRVVLVDFGSAWTLERTASRLPGDGMTPCYASPEQHRGAAFVDFRSDHFSAAVIAYELLTRRLPYDGLGGKAGREDHSVAFAHTLVPPSRLCQDVDRLPGEFWQRLDRVLLTALALEPDKRFATRRTCLDELDALDAHLRLRPRLHPLNQAILNGLDRVWNWLGRRRRDSRAEP
ncbi:MAG: protein kinase [Acidobacteria bacterium]|nr:protein kinase [Acidobacteriota bacterium]